MVLSRVSTATLSSLRPLIYSSTASSRLCTNCLSQTYFHHQQPLRILRRTQATATAHRVQDIPSQPPPPRNAGIPETSIAGGQPQIDNTSGASHSQIPHTVTIQNTDISITEGEAQHSPLKSTLSTPAPTQPSTSTTSSTRPQRPSRLRARKAAMTLTASAVHQLRNLLAQPEPKLIRVGVKNRGCSGLAYHLEYVEKPGTFDESVEQDGVKVLIDSKALFSIIGSEMDWAEDKLSQRFVFRNPNITEQCGCGESFSIG